MTQPKYKPGDKVNYVGGMMRYNAKSGEIVSIIQDSGKYYYNTTFTVQSAGSCAECELKIMEKKSAKKVRK